MMSPDDSNQNGPQISSRIAHVRRFPHAPDFEKELTRYQLMSSVAHVKVLMASGIVKGELADRIIAGIDEIRKEVASGKEFITARDTDMYSAVLRRLGEISGAVAERLNQGRSDEDWLATDVRLWVRDAVLSASKHLIEIRRLLNVLADTHQEVMLPGYAHMQPKRREMLSFFFLSNDSQLRQDTDRFNDLFGRINLLPSGLDTQVLMEYPLDRALLAKLLGFDGVRQNSLDSVVEIDYLLEFASCAAILGMHLSQMASELLLWSTQEFGFVRLPKTFALDTEAFRDRKSAQMFEVLRSRSTLLSARLTEILNQFKGLPFGSAHETNLVLSAVNEVIYNLDFVLELTTTILPALIFDTKKMNDISETDMSNRANAIDYLIEKGFAPDKAVALVEPLVEYCRKRKRSMSDLAPGEWGEFSPAFDRDIYKYVSSDASLGSMGPRYEVLWQAIARGRELLAADEKRLVALSDKLKSLTVEVPSTTE